MKKIGGIIIEGADQQGKTTLIKKLASALGKKFDVKVVHLTAPVGQIDFEHEYTRHLSMYDESVPIIFDRHYMSELVYGSVFRGKPGITEDMKDRIEELFRDRNYLLVMLERKDYKWEERSEMYTQADNLKVMEKYNEVYDSFNVDKMKIDAFRPDAVDRIIASWQLKNNVSM